VVFEKTHSIKEDPEFFCSDCEKLGNIVKLERQISLNKNGSGFIFKQWTAAQCYKVSRDKSKQNAELNLRQIDRYGSGPQLKPNVAGIEVDSWSDAKKLAKESGLNADSYDTYVKKEKDISKSSGVDDNKWKAAKETTVL